MHNRNFGIFKLKGVIQNYDWGGTDFLSQLLSLPNPDKVPMAEYWLGAHGSLPSAIVTADKEIQLNKFIEENTETALGKTSAKKFHRLPYLLKLLDVNTMLSIQVHPAKHEAEVGFARENAAGIPLNAPHRNYKDDNHKPELMVALSDFWALQGFKPAEKLIQTLHAVPEFKPLLEIFLNSGYDQLYKTVMEMPTDSVAQILQPVLNRIILLYQKNELKKTDENFWAARAALTFDKTDRGIFSIYFFNLLHLKKGEGIFQDAGVPHAYLEGQNVEIMANSDNVLRGGLTSKHIDVKELMKHIKFEATVPDIIHPRKTNEGEELYRTAAPDFKLSRYVLKKDQQAKFTSVSGEMIIALNGKILLQSDNSELELSKGEAAFVICEQQVTIKAVSECEAYRASVPVHNVG